MYKISVCIVSVSLFISACSAPTRLDHVERKQYPFNPKEYTTIDSSVWQTILPYKTKLDVDMNVPVGKTTQPLTKDQPEGLLGNFVADLCLAQARIHYKPADNKNVDFCFLNNGGLRASLPEGELTRRNIFEVMPFENELIILTVSGNDVTRLLTYISNKGGVPVAGIQMVIKNKIAEQVIINNAPFDTNKTYKVVTSDYLANGGDDLSFLAIIKERQYVQLKVRDAMLEYCERLKSDGKLIDPKLDNRIKYE